MRQKNWLQSAFVCGLTFMNSVFTNASQKHGSRRLCLRPLVNYFELSPYLRRLRHRVHFGKHDVVHKTGCTCIYIKYCNAARGGG